MAKKKPAHAAPDTGRGVEAYTLASAHKVEVEPRLPAGTLGNLKADLTLLGADPDPAPPPANPGQAPPAPPTLAEAMAGVVALITAVHEAIQGAGAPHAVRKAYGVASKSPTQEPKAVAAVGEKILAEAQADPGAAMALGILPSDTAALKQGLADLAAAEAAAKVKGGQASGVTKKELHAAEVRMHEAVARIAGAGILAFAKNAAVRAEFEGLKKKV